MQTSFMALLPFMLIAACAGAGFALQGPVNAGLARYVGGPVSASFFSFTVGALICAAVFAAAWMWGDTNVRGFVTAPRHLLIGGIFGSAGVIAMAFIVPRLGVGMATTAMMAGQLVAALLADKFGWFVDAPVPLSMRRLAGAGLMLIAVWMLRR